MIDIEPRELSICARRGSRFAALVCSRATSVSPVRTVITCLGVPRCGVAAGTGQRRGAAGGVCRCLPHRSCQRSGCSRSPHRERPLPVTCGLTRGVWRHEMVPVCVEISRWTWSEHRGRNRRDGQPRVFAGVTDQLRVSPGGRDIGVDSLATQLVINRRLTHRPDTVEAALQGRQRRGVDRLWVAARLCAQTVDGCQRRGIRRIPRPTSLTQVPRAGTSQPILHLVVIRRTDRPHSSSAICSRTGRLDRCHRHGAKSTVVARAANAPLTHG
jgi:hypothetical protein